MKSILFILSILITTTTFAQSKVERNLEDFHKLSVFGNIKIELKKGKTNSISLSAKMYDVSKVTTAIDNGELVIRSGAIGEEKETFVVLTFKELDYIKADAGANIFKSSVIEAKNIEIKSLKGSLISLDVQCKSLNLSVNQGGEARLGGSTDNLYIKAYAKAFINCYKMDSKNVEVNAGSGSIVKVNATEKIKAKSKTGASVEYKGSPKTESVEPVLGGKIIKL